MLLGLADYQVISLGDRRKEWQRLASHHQQSSPGLFQGQLWLPRERLEMPKTLETQFQKLDSDTSSVF